jgi:hypothetical protein
MMNNNQLIEWLIAYGNPTIKYRTITELMGNTPNIDNLVDDLLHVKVVDSLLQRLERYGPIQMVDSGTLNSIHTGAGVEGIVAKLIELGMKSGIHVLDSRMQIFRQYVDNVFVHKALSSPGGQDVVNNRAVFIAVLLASYFVHAGYEYDEIISFVKERLDLLYRVASNKLFDIHLSDTELLAYPKRAKSWSLHPVIKPEYDPGCCEKPLPLIHDIFCLAYFPKAFIDKDLENKINRIIEYVLDERFQALPQGYGLLWYKSNRTYYACGWRPELPCLNNYNSEYEKSILVLYMDLMSNFKVARESKWFQNCLNYLEEFKTYNGTYCFPPYLIKDKNNMGYVCGMSMGLGENRKSQKAYEIESTFRMLLIKKRLNTL